MLCGSVTVYQSGYDFIKSFDTPDAAAYFNT